MVNVDMLSKHCQQYRMTKDTAGEYYRQLFMAHPELASFFDAEDIDVDSIPRSQKFIRQGMQDMQYFFGLPRSFADEKQWRRNLSELKETYTEAGMPMNNFKFVGDAFMCALEKHAGGMSAEQKKQWNELFDKAAKDIKEWGW